MTAPKNHNKFTRKQKKMYIFLLSQLIWVHRYTWMYWSSNAHLVLVGLQQSLNVPFCKGAFFILSQKLDYINSQQKNKVILDGRFVFYYIDSAYLKRWALHPNACCGLLIAQDYIQRRWFFIDQSCMKLVIMSFCKGI